MRIQHTKLPIKSGSGQESAEKSLDLSVIKLQREEYLRLI